MFEDILVVTDRNDLAEIDIRHREARERRFLDRLRRVVIELLFPTGPTTLRPDAGPDEIEVGTENATQHAIELARHHGARLHVLFVVDAVRYDTTVEFATEPLVEEGDERVDELIDEAERVGVAATGSVEVGRPARLVLDYTVDHEVDLIVLNARESSGPATWFRRELPRALANRAPVPIYVVPRLQSGHPD